MEQNEKASISEVVEERVKMQQFGQQFLAQQFSKGTY